MTIIPVSQCGPFSVNASINIAHSNASSAYVGFFFTFCKAWRLLLAPSRPQDDRRNANRAANPIVTTRPSQKDTIQTMLQKTIKLPPLRHGDNDAHRDPSGHCAAPKTRRGDEKPPMLACLPLKSSRLERAKVIASARLVGLQNPPF